MEQESTSNPEILSFEDDGTFPNSKFPVVLYRQAFDPATDDLASVFEQRFATNGWTGAWRDRVYAFTHYHSISHEVLAVHKGEAKLRLGGPRKGQTVDVRCGDVIVIPAGVAHQNLKSSADFSVVGAYPNGRRWDLLRGNPLERPGADQNIAQVPLPERDPLYGANGPLQQIWNAIK